MRQQALCFVNLIRAPALLFFSFLLRRKCKENQQKARISTFAESSRKSYRGVPE